MKQVSVYSCLIYMLNQNRTTLHAAAQKNTLSYLETPSRFETPVCLSMSLLMASLNIGSFEDCKGTEDP